MRPADIRAAAWFARVPVIGDHSTVREVVLVPALVLVGCRSVPLAARQMEGGQLNADAIGDEDGSPDRSEDLENGIDAAVDAQDAGIDADPFQCSTVTPLVLSDPKVTSGTVAGGQTVTVQITMTDTDPSGYVSYPGVVLSSSTPGVSFAAAEAGPPGSSIEGVASKPITFSVKLDASIPPGTEVLIAARAYGWGHPAPDCNGFVLSFSLTTT
jgi:hypothetical protein